MDLEFPSLAHYLCLTDESSGDDESMDTELAAHISVCDGLNWFMPPDSSLPQQTTPTQVPEMPLWLLELKPVVEGACPSIAKQLLLVQLLWRQPRLLTVPEKYDTIFQFYHKRPCRRCGNVPKDPTVCLMCGTMVCLKESCCKSPLSEGGICETVAHAQECGGGTGVFLAVNSSTIVVIRGKRACIWGLIYLDSFGEED